MRSASRSASISVLVALVLAAVWLFWPTQLGGSTSYVVTHGISMEPRFHTGDLAVLRPDLSYSIGDVVAYRSESLDTVVMHRIVALDGDRYVIQGDNNDWLDEDHPSDDEVLGRLFLRIPQGGKVLQALSSPWVLALVAVAATGLGAAAHGSRGRARKKHRARREVPLPLVLRAKQVAIGSVVVIAIAAPVCAALLLLPLVQPDVRTVHVSQAGEFTYRASAQPGTTYPSGHLDTGDPIYTNLVDRLTVSFADTVSAQGLTSAEGTLYLDVAVSAPDGWTAPLTRGTPARMNDGRASASVTVSPGDAQDLLDRHYAEIGVAGAGATITVTPVADVAGTVGEHAFAMGPLPPLSFSLDATAMRPAGDSLASASQAAVSIDDLAPRTITLAGHTFTLATARVVSGAVLLAGLVAFLISLWFGRPMPVGPVELIVARNASRILPVAGFTPGDTVIDLADSEALDRVAERFDSLVLHQSGPEGSIFAVQDGDTTYRYVASDDTVVDRSRPRVVPRPRTA